MVLNAATWIPGLRYIFQLRKSPEKTESGYFIDTWVINRSVRNDDCRDDRLWKWPMLKPSPVWKKALPLPVCNDSLVAIGRFFKRCHMGRSAGEKNVQIITDLGEISVGRVRGGFCWVSLTGHLYQALFQLRLKELIREARQLTTLNPTYANTTPPDHSRMQPLRPPNKIPNEMFRKRGLFL